MNIQGKYCNEDTKNELRRYWALREKDLRAMYLSQEQTTEELIAFLKDEGVEIPERKDYSDEDEWREALEEACYERSYDYGLSIDIVEPCTFKDQPERFLRYQFSWGGGQDELRFYFDCGSDDYIIAEYWYLNWGTGCFIDVTGLDIIDQIWEHLSEIFYDKIRNCTDSCEDYEDCEPKYIPEECKDYISIATRKIENMDDEEIIEVSAKLIPSEVRKTVLEVIEDEFPSGEVRMFDKTLNRNPDAEELVNILSKIAHRNSDAYDDIIDMLRDELLSQVEYDEDDAVWVYEHYGGE